MSVDEKEIEREREREKEGEWRECVERGEGLKGVAIVTEYVYKCLTEMVEEGEGSIDR